MAAQKLTHHSIWLEDVADLLPNKSVYLHGFDISSTQYPPLHEIQRPGQNPIPLSVHNALAPFPAEHRGRYDLVHIRLLTAGLKQVDYIRVLANARDLLSVFSLPFLPLFSLLSSLFPRQKNTYSQTRTPN